MWNQVIRENYGLRVQIMVNGLVIGVFDPTAIVTW